MNSLNSHVGIVNSSKVKTILVLSASLFLLACSSEEEPAINTQEARGVLTEQQQNALDAANSVADLLQDAADDTEKELKERLDR
ncbi:MAG: hypothetical protein HOF74_04295 [Gammaproteobacteria bacterium]|nr:hypothetical protein [Gammaproteobacteria bacterium]MBT3859028.1 hypothetical protein [Gammaproteobacteria bacterium]MBT3987861.1 hypothetical protein [Gammaproteobacteria bacterium]MBT4254752.1 hypothetical protein [Gammaproteobacteria bacterium]MBT4583299.1 hypothetical protein [Gammaproteobacteria bacterium]